VHVRGIRHPYSWGRDHPLISDALIALVVVAFGVLTELAQPDAGADENLRDPNTFSLVLVVLGTLPLIWRRRRPIEVFVVVWAVTLVHTALAFPGGGPIAAGLFALYAVAAHADSRRSAVHVLLGAMGSATVLPLFDATGATWTDLIPVYALLVAAWVLGDNIRVRRANVAAVEERAARLERERDAEAQRAVLRERTRIARELHDVVAHSMSVMVVQAGAARRTLERDPERAGEALLHIEATGRGALEEMRRLVGVLRQDGDEGAGIPDESAARLPQPGIGEMPHLIRQCEEAGLPVSLAVVGMERPLPSGVELVVYRVLQEALTNTMKHAGPARADVVLRYGDDQVALVVCDNGRGALSRPPEALSGHGLTGMRERVALYGGSIDAGPRPGGGFRVRAELPVTPDPAAL
jgi:signal transduction histidine kinase